MQSGIEEIKIKTKLSLDEMYDNQLDGNPDIQINGNIEKKTTIHPSVQQELKPAEHSKNQSPMQVNEKMSVEDKKYFHSQITPKEPTYKMTFNLSPEIFKGFNDIYAKRLLNGRKTEKSELICEAIRLLIQTENENFPN